MNDIEDRYKKYMTMELPGQPIGMHMGTSILMYDMRAEIASLRAQNEVTHKAYVKENNRLMAERESLRADLSTTMLQRDEWQARYCATVGDLRTKLWNTVGEKAVLRADLAECKSACLGGAQSIRGLRERRHHDKEEIETLRATALQDAEEKVRLKEVVEYVAANASTREIMVEKARAALAYRPQGERSET